MSPLVVLKYLVILGKENARWLVALLGRILNCFRVLEVLEKLKHISLSSSFFSFFFYPCGWGRRWRPYASNSGGLSSPHQPLGKDVWCAAILRTHESFGSVPFLSAFCCRREERLHIFIFLFFCVLDKWESQEGLKRQDHAISAV